ncbi:MAG: hypothetical protein HN590_15370 [Calditrichaeota bacterium]|nr:hypothetical protein [Calditrichota bacterium]
MSKKVRCIDCHFLVGTETSEIAYSLQIETKTILTKAKREILKKKSQIVINSRLVSVSCHHGFWDRGHDYSKCFDEIFMNRLPSDCLFWPYKKDLSTQGAELLQKRTEDRKAFKTTMLYSRLAIILAAVALLFNLIGLLENSRPSQPKFPQQKIPLY